MVTTIRPSEGVSAHGVGLIEIGSVAVPFGAIVGTHPAIELDHASKGAVPSTGSGPRVGQVEPTAEYAKRGLAAPRHGSFARHSCEFRMTMRIVELSVGASARKAMLAPAAPRAEHERPMTPLKAPVCTAP